MGCIGRDEYPDGALMSITLRVWEIWITSSAPLCFTVGSTALRNFMYCAILLGLFGPGRINGIIICTPDKRDAQFRHVTYLKETRGARRPITFCVSTPGN